MFPPSDQQSLELHMLTMIQDLAASLLMEFEKWVLRAESTGTILKTPLDSQSSLGSEEVIKAKKRRLGRAQKIIGDYCLLPGSPVDANAHYTTAIELARLTGDVFWHAGALEGSVCALVVDRMGESDPVLEDEVKYRYYTIIQLYRRATLQDNAQRVSPVSFELEAALKLARYLCRQELAKEVSDLLMGAADGAKALIDASDRLILYIEIARLFGTLGYKRKAAFFSRQVAQLYLQQDNAYAAMSAMQVLTMTTNAYHVQSRKAVKMNHDLSKEPRAVNTDSVKVHPQSIVSLFESQWSTLQMVVLRDILMSSIRATDPLSSWSAAARLLRSFYPLITPAGQSGLASSLANSAGKLPTGTRCADPCLPGFYQVLQDLSFTLLSAKQELLGLPSKRCCGSSKFKCVNFPSISVVPPLPLLVANVVGGDGSILLYEGEIRDVLITLTNARTVPVEEAHVALSGKNQDSVISIAHSTWKSALPIKPGGEVTFAVTLRAWHLSSADLETDGSRSPANPRRIAREGINPFLDIHYAGPAANLENGDISLPPGRRLVVPLNICVVQGMRLVRARLLSMEIPAQFTETHIKPVSGKDVNLLKVDPYKGSWGFRLLELELFNPTDVVFYVDVAVHLDDVDVGEEVISEGDAACHKTRIDRDYSARVLVPLENFKLPVFDASFFVKESSSDEPLGSRAATIAERNAKAELNVSIDNLISKIKVKWHSGRNSSGELNIKDAILAAIQASIIDILLPDPLTFSFKLAKNGTVNNVDSSKDSDDVLRCKDPISAHEMIHMEVQVCNNTKEIIRMNLNISCK
ncbi:Trafficking protein particle complex II-specific subunit 120-like protein, partial [Zea mays]